MATYSDNFNRANVSLDSDSPAYLAESTLYPLQIISNQFAHSIPSFGVAARRYPGLTDTVTQYARFTLAVLNSNDETLGVILRASGAGTFYNLTVGATVIGIEKYVAESYTAINGGTGQYFSTTNSANDVFELRVVTNGSSVELRAYKNSSLVTNLGSSGVLSDSAGDRILTGNYVGLFGYANTSPSTIRGDDWEGGDYVAASGGAPRFQRFHMMMRNN